MLYEAAVSLIGKNAEFGAVYEYYRSRKKNPLKKMQSVVAAACKLIRVFYAILTKGVDYDAEKMMGDIRRYRKHSTKHRQRENVPATVELSLWETTLRAEFSCGRKAEGYEEQAWETSAARCRSVEHTEQVSKT